MVSILSRAGTVTPAPPICTYIYLYSYIYIPYFLAWGSGSSHVLCAYGSLASDYRTRTLWKRDAAALDVGGELLTSSHSI